MLDELKNLKYNGGKEGLLFFICDVIGHSEIKIRDAEIICSHAPGKRHLSVRDLISYCLAFRWIKTEGNAISISPSLATLVDNKEVLNNELIISTVAQLFDEEILKPTMFSYDAVQCCYSFKNDFLPLIFSSVRNVLISQGFLMPIRDNNGVRFYIEPSYDALVAKHCKTKSRQFSLDMLKKRLEDNELAGETAELFVLAFEQKRIGEPLCESVRRISEIEVSAGYDIVSFNSERSQKPDRFIEVKAVSGSGFFWSRNEYEIAKLKGETYYLYLVELRKINDPDYCPEIIQNPAVCIMDSDEWFIESQSYRIKRI